MEAVGNAWRSGLVIEHGADSVLGAITSGRHASYLVGLLH